MKSLRIPFLAALSLILSAPPAPAQPAAAGLPAGVARVTSVEGVTEYRLANGLKILLIPDRSVDTVTVNVTYLVGSRQEGYGETGMAHLLEHLMFRGTPRFRASRRISRSAERAITGAPRSTGPTTSKRSPRTRRHWITSSMSKPTAWSTPPSPGATSTRK